MKNYRYFIFMLCSLACVLLTGCASITTGLHEPISVETTPATQASCSLQNNKGIWYINQTPGSVMIHRSAGALHVKCNKPGYKQGELIVPAQLKAMAFGNVVFGGVVGAGVDGVDGAAFHYPQDIKVAMTKQ